MTESGSPAAERLVRTFLELVRIDSPPGEEAKVAEYCARALADLGCAVRFDDSARRTGSDTGNLIAELPGSAPGTLLLSAHMDCVEPCRGVEPVVEDGVIVSAGPTVLGADDKAGIAAILEAIARVKALGRPHPAIRVVLSVKEEVGLQGAKALAPSDVEGDLCLVLDAHGRPGGIVTGAPTHYTFAATFKGRAAHAGVSPEKGVSAVVMASKAIVAMNLGRLDEETTANIGSISGGAATNVVPAQVHVTGECRSRNRERVEALRSAMDTVMRQAAESAKGHVDIAWQLEYESFAVAKDDPAIDLVRAACADAGLESELFTTGGGSDANIIAARGVSTLALSCGMTGVHSTEEQLSIADLESLTRLVVAVVDRVAARGV